MLRLRQMKSLQKLSGVHAAFHNPFNKDRRLTKKGQLQRPTLGSVSSLQT